MGLRERKRERECAILYSRCECVLEVNVSGFHWNLPLSYVWLSMCIAMLRHHSVQMWNILSFRAHTFSSISSAPLWQCGWSHRAILLNVFVRVMWCAPVGFVYAEWYAPRCEESFCIKGKTRSYATLTHTDTQTGTCDRLFHNTRAALVKM